MFSGYDDGSAFELLLRDASCAWYVRLEVIEKPLRGVTRWLKTSEEWQALTYRDSWRPRLGAISCETAFGVAF